MRRWRAVALALALVTSALAARAAEPVRLVLMYPAGGGIDAIARAMAPKLSQKWDRPVIVDNRPGAGGTIATQLIAKAAPDGAALLMTDVSYAITPSLYATLPYDPAKDLVAVTILNRVSGMFVVHPSLPVSSIKELIAYAKEQPGRINYASAGNGTPNHLGMEMLKRLAGIDLVHVPYKGAMPALLDVVAGHEQIYVGALASTVPFVQDGKLRALAVTDRERSPQFPELETIAEAGFPGYDVSSWYALLAPAGTPSALVAEIQRDIASVLRESDLLALLKTLGCEPVANSPAEAADFIAAELAKWREAVKIAGVKAD
jgi:tripartite-type tricarboxylate transporter receptor subunit TctC